MTRFNSCLGQRESAVRPPEVPPPDQFDSVRECEPGESDATAGEHGEPVALVDRPRDLQVFALYTISCFNLQSHTFVFLEGPKQSKLGEHLGSGDGRSRERG